MAGIGVETVFQKSCFSNVTDQILSEVLKSNKGFYPDVLEGKKCSLQNLKSFYSK